MFGRLLGWYTIYAFLRFSHNGISPGAKFPLRPSLAFSYIGEVTARHSNSGHQVNSAAFTRWRHLYSAGWPSCWVSAHILVIYVVLVVGRWFYIYCWTKMYFCSGISRATVVCKLDVDTIVIIITNFKPWALICCVSVYCVILWRHSCQDLWLLLVVLPWWISSFARMLLTVLLAVFVPLLWCPWDAVLACWCRCKDREHREGAGKCQRAAGGEPSTRETVDLSRRCRDCLVSCSQRQSTYQVRHDSHAGEFGRRHLIYHFLFSLKSFFHTGQVR